MDTTSIIGLCAGMLTTIAFVPQAFKTWRSGMARDTSLFTSVLFTVGVLLWLIYGIALQAVPIIVANAITLTLSALILAMKVRDVRRQRRAGLAAGRRAL